MFQAESRHAAGSRPCAPVNKRQSPASETREWELRKLTEEFYVTPVLRNDVDLIHSFDSFFQARHSLALAYARLHSMRIHGVSQVFVAQIVWQPEGRCPLGLSLKSGGHTARYVPQLLEGIGAYFKLMALGFPLQSCIFSTLPS